jgi:hypothetical protein
MACCFVSGLAQYRDTGKLHNWTVGTVSRLNSPDGQLRIVRAAKQVDFDRVVFEFADGVPSFTVNYPYAPVYDEATGTSVKISGMEVIEVSFRFDRDQTAKIYKGYPKTKLNLPVLLEIKNTDGTEGRMAFALGLEARHEFRVQILRNPARLVVDIKH